MELYWNTLAVVMGILTPAFAVLAFKGFVDWAAAYRAYREEGVERAKKEYPYSKIVAFKAPNPTMLSLQFFKGDQLVYTCGADKGVGPTGLL